MLASRNLRILTLMSLALTVCASVALGQTCDGSVYGPQKFVREKGAKTEYTATVTALAGISSPYTLHIQNGDADGSNRVSSAIVTLNETTVVTLSDLNQNVATLDRAVALTAQSTLKVVLASSPGSYLTIDICGVRDQAGDNTPPTIRSTLSPEPNQYGWNNSGVTVTFTCSDAESGVASCPAPATTNAEGRAVVLTGTARDNAGNTTTASVTLSIDKTPPVVTIQTPTTGSYSTTGQVTVTGTATDALSGIATLTCSGIAVARTGSSFSTTLALSEGPHTIVVTATDSAGNATSTSISDTVDLTAPVVKITSPLNGTTTSQQTVNVAWTIDNISQTTETTQNLVDGLNTIVRRSTDAAGNVGADTVSVYYAPAGPLVSILSPINGYKSSSASVSFTVKRLTSGLNNIAMLVDGEISTSSFTRSGDVYSATMSVAEGHHTFIVYSENTVGRKDTARVSFKVATTPAPTQVTIRGVVFDGQNGVPVVGATASVVETGSSVTTDAEGRFVLPSGGFGDYRVKVSHPSFTIAMRTANAFPGIDVDLGSMQVMPLNTEKVSVPAGKDTTVLLPKSLVELDVPHGALTGDAEVSATLFTHINQLPGPQPGYEVFLFSVDLQPGGLTFRDSVTVRVPNLNSLSAGAKVPLTYFNENTAQWDNVGMAQVTPSGESIEFKAIHFSTYHGNVHEPDTSLKDTITDTASSCPVNQGASGVAVKTGDLELDYTVKGGPALVNLDVRLAYLSSTAKPRRVISIGNSTINMIPTYLGVEIVVPGFAGDWTFDGPANPYSMAYHLNAGSADLNLETGMYPYGIILNQMIMPGSYRYQPYIAENLSVVYKSVVERRKFYYGFITVVNREKSPFGSGWTVGGVTRLVSRKGGLSRAYPPRAWTNPATGKLEFVTGGDEVPKDYPVATALGGARGDLWGNHVAVVGEGCDGVFFWRDTLGHVYRPTYGSRDTLFATGDGWTRRTGAGVVEVYSPNGALLSRSDAKGRTTEYEYDAFSERVTIIRDRATGAETRLEYDGKDRLSAVVDQFGRRTAISVDDNGDLVRIVDPDGRTAREFEYRDHLAVRKTMPSGGSSSYSFDFHNAVVRTVNPQGLETNYERVNDGAILNDLAQTDLDPAKFITYKATVCDGKGSCITASWRIPDYPNQPVHRLPNVAAKRYRFFDQFGNATLYHFDRQGRTAAITNPKGETTRYEYLDGSTCNCGAASSTISPNGLRISRQADLRGNLSKVTNSATGAATEYSYVTINEVDYVSSVRNALGQVTSFSYDARGNLTQIVAPGFDTTAITYDSLDQPVAVRDAAGRTVQTRYDSFGRVRARLNATGDSTVYTYDSYGNLAKITDPMGRTTNYAYDDMGRLLREIDPARNITRYAYDGAGQLDSLIDAKGHSTTFDYDTAGNLVQSRNPLGFARRYQYGVHGELLKYTNARGMAVNYDYDPLQRLIRKATDDSVVLARFGYSSVGNMVYAATPEYAINRIFDQASRMVQEDVVELKGATLVPIGDTIAADNFSYDYTDVVVSGGAVVIDGEHHFLSLRLEDGAVVKHLPTTLGSARGLTVFARDSIVIDASSRIDATGLGYQGGGRYLPPGGTLGITYPNTPLSGSQPGAGGSHGGKGGDYRFQGGSVPVETSLGFPAKPYGDRLSPTLPGGGGGSNGNPGFNGGGVVHLNAPILVLNGDILANGESAINENGGAGAGGSVMIEAQDIRGIGRVQAGGGDGLWSAGLGPGWYGIAGGGGGGRVLVSAESPDGLLLTASGGQYGGANGSVVRIVADQTEVTQLSLSTGDTLKLQQGDDTRDGQNIVANGGVIVMDGAHTLAGLALIDGAVLTHSQADTSSIAGLDLTVSGILRVDSTSRIDAIGLGYRGARNSQCAHTDGFQCGATGTSGGSYGGLGGLVGGNAARIFGSIMRPSSLGSGGSANGPDTGGNGGGRISLRAHTAIVDGAITANGLPGIKGGGGSGGSVLISVDTMWGVGRISADGGIGCGGAGGGSGGRVSVLGGISQGFSAKRTTSNGAFGKELGSAGTVYIESLDTTITATRSASLVDASGFIINRGNSTWEGADVKLKNASVVLNGAFTCRSLALSSSSLTHDTPRLLQDSGLTLVASDSIVIDSRSVIDVSGKGYAGGTDTTCAQSVGFVCGSTGMSGGSFGGAGGDLGSTNPSYGDYRSPREFGSGGACSVVGGVGGAGGGRAVLRTARLRLDGNIRANGWKGLCGGGGSGGALVLDAMSIGGIGRISASGGNSTSEEDCAGGGGGGGRILFAKSNFVSPFGLSKTNVYGGFGLVTGESGSIYLADRDSLIRPVQQNGLTIQNDTLVIDQGDATFDNLGVSVINGGLIVMGPHTFKSLAMDGATAEFNDTTDIGYDLTMTNNSVVSHPRATYDKAYRLLLRVGGRVYIDSSSGIDVTGKGYRGGGRDSLYNWHDAQTVGNQSGSGYCCGSYWCVSGGSYGGKGGYDQTWCSGVAGLVGPVYGDPVWPDEPGSGGAASAYYYSESRGGDGGGYVYLQTHAMQCDGLIRADGFGARTSWAGGSGGGVLIIADSIQGTGSISANGGLQGFPIPYGYGMMSTGANGGGGRIAIHASTFFGMDTSKIFAKAARSYSSNAADGSVFIGLPGIISDDTLLVKSSFLSRVEQGIIIAADDRRFDGLNVFARNVMVEIQGDHAFRAMRFDSCQVNFHNSLTCDSLIMSASNGICEGLQAHGDVSLRNSTILQERKSDLFSTYPLHIEAGGRISIDVSSKIDVSGSGYVGEKYLSVGKTSARTIGNAIGSTGISAGGSYGGKAGSASQGRACSLYGNYLEPKDMGSGGAVNYDGKPATAGGDGGGAAFLVARAILCDGSILANGGNVSGNGGGGSGGSILLKADSLFGAGALRANGGNGTSNCGGGGGRIAVYGYQLLALSPSNIAVAPGPGGSRGSAYAFKMYDSTMTIVCGSGIQDTSLMLSTGKNLLDHYHISVLPQGRLIVESGHHFKAIDGDSVVFKGINTIDSLKGGAIYAHDTLKAGFVWFKGAKTSIIDGVLQVAGNMKATDGAVVTHSPADTAMTYSLRISVGDTLQIDSTAKLNVTGRGYAGEAFVSGVWRSSRGFGNAPTTLSLGSLYAGGTHGGKGGALHASLVATVYGDVCMPGELGSGAGCWRYYSTSFGGDGGGAIGIYAGDLVLNGSIEADGEAGMIDGGGGSGGSITLQVANRISGRGTLTAIGGRGYVSPAVAGGGGGRIGIHAATMSDSLMYKAWGGSPGAGAGTIYLRDSLHSLGVLVFNNNGQASPDGSTPLISIGPGTITGLSSGTLSDTNATFSSFVAGHLVRPRWSYAGWDGAFTVTAVDTHALVVDTTHGILTAAASVGDDYIGVYPLDSVCVQGGAKVVTAGLVFCNNIYLNNGSFTSFTGTQTGMRGSGECGIRSAELQAKKPTDSRWAMRLGVAWQAHPIKPVIVHRKPSQMSAIQRKTNPNDAGDTRRLDIGRPTVVSSTQTTMPETMQQLASSAMLSDAAPYHGFVSRFVPKEDRLGQVVPAGTMKKKCANGDPIYTYDVLDRVTSMTSPVGTTKYHYDDSTGRLDEIETPQGKTFRYEYDRGQLKALQYPNGIVANYDFDDNGNLTDLNYLRGDGSTVQRFQYDYDKNGMRTSMTDNDGVHNYTYDSLYQIIGATHPTVQNPLERFEYDAVGNRLSDNVKSAYRYNELNELAEDDSCWYSYDFDGNQTEKVNKTTGDTTHYVFDIEKKLVEVKEPGLIARYAYDATGRRMKKEVNGVVTEFRYDRANLLLEMNGSESISASYTSGPGIDNPLAMQRGGISYYYLKDGLRSVRCLTDSAGNTVQEYRYGVFGVIMGEAPNASDNSLAYAGREWDSETETYYLRTREYDPNLGRFLAQDLAGFLSGDVNFYRYVRNNSLNFVDPFGLCDIVAKEGNGRYVKSFFDVYLLSRNETGMLILDRQRTQDVVVTTTFDFTDDMQVTIIGDPSPGGPGGNPVIEFVGGVINDIGKIVGNSDPYAYTGPDSYSIR